MAELSGGDASNASAAKSPEETKTSITCDPSSPEVAKPLATEEDAGKSKSIPGTPAPVEKEEKPAIDLNSPSETLPLAKSEEDSSEHVKPLLETQTPDVSEVGTTRDQDTPADTPSLGESVAHPADDPKSPSESSEMEVDSSGNAPFPAKMDVDSSQNTSSPPVISAPAELSESGTEDQATDEVDQRTSPSDPSREITNKEVSGENEKTFPLESGVDTDREAAVLGEERSGGDATSPQGSGENSEPPCTDQIENSDLPTAISPKPTAPEEEEAEEGGVTSGTSSKDVSRGSPSCAKDSSNLAEENKMEIGSSELAADSPQKSGDSVTHGETSCSQGPSEPDGCSSDVNSGNERASLDDSKDDTLVEKDPVIVTVTSQRSESWTAETEAPAKADAVTDSVTAGKDNGVDDGTEEGAGDDCDNAKVEVSAKTGSTVNFLISDVCSVEEGTPAEQGKSRGGDTTADFIDLSEEDSKLNEDSVSDEVSRTEEGMQDGSRTVESEKSGMDVVTETASSKKETVSDVASTPLEEDLAGKDSLHEDGSGKSGSGIDKSAENTNNQALQDSSPGVLGGDHGKLQSEPGDQNKDDDVVMIEDNLEASVGKDAESEASVGKDAESEKPASANKEGDVSVEEKKDDEEMETSTTVSAASPVPEVDDDDVIILDEKGEIEAIDVDALDDPEVSSASITMDPNNDMGLHIASVRGGMDISEFSKTAVKKEPLSPQTKVAVKSPSTTSSSQTGIVSYNRTSSGRSASRIRICIVCRKLVRCKYNIVRNGEVNHLCDDTCFKAFRATPSLYLGGNASANASQPHQAPSAAKASLPGMVSSPHASAPHHSSASHLPSPPQLSSSSMPARAHVSGPTPLGQNSGSLGQGIKTCRICELMNINTSKVFCNWQGFDFCSDVCLGKFQQMLGNSCFNCKTRIQPQQRTQFCVKAGSDMRIFCSQTCQRSFDLKMTVCAHCSKDLAGIPDSFSAPVGPLSQFKEFCSQMCMTQFEKQDLSRSQTIPSNCAVCNQPRNNLSLKVKLKTGFHIICGVRCLDAFKFANKVEITQCDHCQVLCTSEEAQQHFIQFEGRQHFFCTDACVNLFRRLNRKAVVCAWCGTRKQNFDMIERVDSNSSFQLFCSLNCLSLYRVNLQAKSNQAVACDQCRKVVPAQYHLTMSDASVRNFCSYGCVVAYQSQFAKPATGGAPVVVSQPMARSGGTPRQSSRQAARAATLQPKPTSSQQPSFPIISNVVSLAPQQAAQKQQTVNIKTNTSIPVVVKGPAGQTIKTTAGSAQTTTMGPPVPVQQQIIIQPPAPKTMKNKSLLCKPFVQTKATSCRPHSQTKACQTDDSGPQTVLIPVPVPIYIPMPLPMYTAPTPHPIPIPIPVPVPIFIPTTKKSADGILKHIKEISEKIPTDPLEAEMLMMAEAVADHGKDSSSDSDSDNDLPSFALNEKAEEKVEKGLAAGVGAKTETAPVEEEDMLQMAMRMAEEMTEPMDLEAAVEPIPINTEPPPPRPPMEEEDEFIPVPETRKRAARRQTRTRTRSSKRQKVEAQAPPPVPTPPPAPVVAPPQPPADATYYLKFTFGVRAWRQWVVQMNAKLEGASKRGSGRLKLFKTDLLQCTADELNYSLCLFVKEIRKPTGGEYSSDSIYYLCLGIQQYLFENGRIDNIFTDVYYEKFTSCLNEILLHYEPKLNEQGQMLCRIEEEHLWECKQLGAHSPHVLLNTLVYFNTKHFMLKTPEEHMKLSFAHILKHWRRGAPGRALATANTNASTPSRSVSLRFYCLTPNPKTKDAKKPKEGIPVYETQENSENPLRCPVKLYEFFLSKCPESVKNRNDMFYLVPERSCVPDSPVWYSTQPIGTDAMAKMLNRIMLVREIQEAHLHPQPIYV